MLYFNISYNKCILYFYNILYYNRQLNKNINNKCINNI